MKCRIDEIEIPKENPFANDKLNRYGDVIKFVDFVSRYSDFGCVIALNGEWGCGKTTFIKMTQQLMQNNHYRTLYFNAWENDFVEEPLIALLAAIRKQISPVRANEAFWMKAAQVLAIIGNSILKNKTGYDIEEIANSLHAQMDECAQQIQAFSEFKQALQEYVASYNDAETGNANSIVFFIDELDRCAPLYVVKVLERIKHLFNIPNIVFVLSINKSIIRKSICTYYGNNDIDSDNYLRRYIDFDYDMPSNDLQAYSNWLYDAFDMEKYENSYENKHTMDGKIQFDNFKYFVDNFFSCSKFDLRTTERLYSQIKGVIDICNGKSVRGLDVMAFLCYLKVMHRSLYIMIKEHSITANELVSSIADALATDLDATKVHNSFDDWLTQVVAETIYSALFFDNNRPKLEDLKEQSIPLVDIKLLLQKWEEICNHSYRPIRIDTLLEFVDLNKRPFVNN